MWLYLKTNRSTGKDMRALASSGLKSVEASDGDAGNSPYQSGSESSGGEVLDRDVDFPSLRDATRKLLASDSQAKR